MQYRIRALRNKLGLTQEEFGGRLGLGRTALSKIESGTVEATPQTIRFICREFGVDYLWLTTGEGEAFRDDQRVLHELIDTMMQNASSEERQAFHEIVKLDRRYWVTISKFMKEILQQ